MYTQSVFLHACVCVFVSYLVSVVEPLPLVFSVSVI